LSVVLGDPLAVFAVRLIGDLLADRAIGKIAVTQPVEGVADVAEHGIRLFRMNADHDGAPQKPMPCHERQHGVVEGAERHAPLLEDRAEPMRFVVEDPLVVLANRREAIA